VVFVVVAAVSFSGAVENFYTLIEMQFSRAAHFEIISSSVFVVLCHCLSLIYANLFSIIFKLNVNLQLVKAFVIRLKKNHR